VRAAGGVPWRRRDDGDIEVLLVHRPRHRDWTFPKGKVEEGETDEQAALREVEEETGLRCSLGAELASTSYTDSKLRPKTVRYWALEAAAGDAAPRDEVDEVAWLPPHEAAERLSYRRDRDVLHSLEAAL
jgi:8-oxo-dGTP pyrophosphatase MutT (NUDIX family)